MRRLPAMRRFLARRRVLRGDEYRDATSIARRRVLRQRVISLFLRVTPYPPCLRGEPSNLPTVQPIALRREVLSIKPGRHPLKQ